MKTRLFIADDILTLDSGKHIVSGIYPDNVVTCDVPGGAANDSDAAAHRFPFGSNLSMMLNVSELSGGPYDIWVWFDGPGIEEYMREPRLFKLDVKSTQSANLILKFQPFVVTSAGMYTLFADIAGTRVREKFKIRLSVAGQLLPRLV